MRLGDQTLIRIYAKHEPYTDGHLGEVATAMMSMGAPRIEVVEWRGDYFAVEGSHRLAAAHELGLVPDLIVSLPDLLEPEAEQFWEAVKKTLPHYSWLMPNVDRVRSFRWERTLVTQMDEEPIWPWVIVIGIWGVLYVAGYHYSIF